MDSEAKNKIEFFSGGKNIEVYQGRSTDSPVLYLNTFEGEGGCVYKALQNMGAADFTLVAISNLNWNHDMSVWAAPAVFKGDKPFTGGAGEYLKLLTEEIMPKAEEYIEGRVLWRGIAGYSLAGLFAVYSMYHTKIFSRAASMSGSLWFPGFKEYVFANEMKKKPDYLYVSLGDRESRTKNCYMKNVQENTESIIDFYRKSGIYTEFVLNPGNHFKDVTERTSSGLHWILSK